MPFRRLWLLPVCSARAQAGWPAGECDALEVPSANSFATATLRSFATISTMPGSRDCIARGCVFSLHRAEGYGLPLNEAMAHGMPVVATGWSGNLDFMASQTVVWCPTG